MTRQAARMLEDIGIIIIAHRLRHLSVLQHRNTIAMTRHHAKVLGGIGADHNMGEVVGVLIHAHHMYVTKETYGTVKPNLNVKV